MRKPAEYMTSANPNTVDILWDGTRINAGESFSSGYESYDVIPHEWGFELLRDNGYIAPPTRVNFGKYVGETSFDNAHDRMMNFLRINSIKSSRACCL